MRMPTRCDWNLASTIEVMECRLNGRSAGEIDLFLRMENENEGKDGA